MRQNATKKLFYNTLKTHNPPMCFQVGQFRSGQVLNGMIKQAKVRTNYNLFIFIFTYLPT